MSSDWDWGGQMNESRTRQKLCRKEERTMFCKKLLGTDVTMSFSRMV